MKRPVARFPRSPRRLAPVALPLIALMSFSPSCAGPPDPSQPGTGGRADVKESTELVHPEDGAQLVEYPWGWIRWRMNSEIEPAAEMTFGVVQVDAHQVNPLHLHSNCAEYLYVLSGSCEHRIGEEWVPLKQGDLVRIPAGVEHMARTLEEPMRAVIAYSAGTRDFTVVEGEEE